MKLWGRKSPEPVTPVGTGDIQFCGECGRGLVIVKQRGAGGFANEDWTVRRCAVGNVPEHEWAVIKAVKRPPNFDPHTGEATQ